jgi:hypothetical protein
MRRSFLPVYTANQRKNVEDHPRIGQHMLFAEAPVRRIPPQKRVLTGPVGPVSDG